MAQYETTSLAGQGAVIVRPSSPSENRMLFFLRGGGEHAGYPADDHHIDYDAVVNVDTRPLAGLSGSYWSPFVYFEGMRKMTRYLVERGYTIVFPKLWDSTLNTAYEFGNDTSTTLLDDVIDATQALPGMSAGKYGFLTFSMGSCTAANYARRFGQTNLAGILSFCPVANVSANWRGTDAAHGSAYANVNKAWGIGGTDGLTACDTAWNAIKGNVDPILWAPNVTVPWAVWTNAIDQLVLEAHADSLNTAIPSAYRNRLNMGYGNMGQTYFGFPWPTSFNLYGHNYSEFDGKEVHDYISTWSW